ncbi:MAG: TRAP transporter small permease [Hyphomicrobiaceae bacterium]|nr:TRAP transporter small permease [Hyphomicrobiaceae bacterium]
MLRILDRLEEILVGFLMAAATTIIFVAVMHRYGLSMIAAVFNYGRSHDMPGLTAVVKDIFLAVRSINLTWAQELCIIMFVWMAKFGAAYGVRTGIHVGVDVMVNKLSKSNRDKFVVLSLLAGALFTGIIGSLGANFVWHMAHTDATSPDLEMPMWIVYLAIPIGSYLMCFRFLQVAVNFLRTGELPHHDHGHVDGMDEVDDLPVAGTNGGKG